MDFKKMREYTHEEFVNLILSLDEQQLLELSAKYGGYPVLFRMALDDRISHIPFIQTGAAIIIRNENGQILLQERTDSNEIELIDTLSGESRKNSYPNGDIVYNNTSLYLADVSMEDASNLKGDSETKRLRFFNPEEVPENLMDADLIKSYISYMNKRHK